MNGLLLNRLIIAPSTLIECSPGLPACPMTAVMVVPHDRGHFSKGPAASQTCADRQYSLRETMKVSTCVWASVLLGGALVGAQGYHRVMAKEATGDTAAATPTPQPKSTLCRTVSRNIPAPPASAPLSVRIYFEWMSLERRANVLVKDALSALPRQSFSTTPTHCESARPVHAT